LPESHEWACSVCFAEKKKKEGRARGGFLGKKREWKEQGCELISREESGMVMTELKLEGETSKIVSIFDWEVKV